MKKTVSLILCAALLASLLCSCAFAAGGTLNNFTVKNTYTEGMFTDVAAGDWYADDVAAAYGYDLMIGQSNTLFGSTANITVGEVVALASKIHMTYYGITMDMSSGSVWYKPYVTYAVNNNIIEADDYSDYTLPATREQMAKIIYKAMPNEALPAINSIKAGDIPDVSTGAVNNYLYVLYNAGIVSGRNAGGRFYPNEKITRCEVAAIAARMADKTLRVTFTIDPSKDFIDSNENLGNTEGSGNVANEATLLSSVNNARTLLVAANKSAQQAYAYRLLPIGKLDPSIVAAETLTGTLEPVASAATMCKEAALFCKNNALYSAAYTPLYKAYDVGANYASAVALVVTDLTNSKAGSTPKEKAEHWQLALNLINLMLDNTTTAYNTIAGVQK